MVSGFLVEQDGCEELVTTIESILARVVNSRMRCELKMSIKTRLRVHYEKAMAQQNRYSFYRLQG